MATPAPVVAGSSREERLAYVRRRFPCMSDCDQCGLCALFHGHDATVAFRDYVDGRAEFGEVARRYRGVRP